MIGSEQCKAEQESFELSLDPEVVWRTNLGGGELSLVGCSEDHIDKPQTLFFFVGVNFQYFSFDLLDFLKAQHQKRILTVPAFFIVSFRNLHGTLT